MLAKRLLLASTFTMGIAFPAPLPDSRVQISDILLFFCFLALAPHFKELGRILRSPALGFGLLYVGLCAASAWKNQVGFAYALGSLELLALFGCGLFFSSGAAGENLSRDIARWWVSGVALLCLVGLLGTALDLLGWETAIGPYKPNWTSFRIKGAAASPNLLASLSIFPMLLLLALKPPIFLSRAIRLAVLCLLSFSFLLTTSRSLLALALGLLVLKHRSRWQLAAGTVGLAGLLAVSVGFQIVYNDGTVPAPITASVRMQILKSAWDTFLANPWLGIGPGERVAVTKFPSPDETFTTSWSAHNTILNVAAATGAPALAAFLIFLWMAWKPWIQGVEKGSLAAVCRAAVLAMLFDALAVDSERFRHLWLLLGMNCGLLHGGGSGSEEKRLG